MNLDKVRHLESEFLAGMEGNLENAQGTLLRGSLWKVTRHDDTDRVRSLMAQHRKFDRRLLSELPKNRRTILHAYKRPWWFFGRKRTGVAVASVLSPLAWHVDQDEATRSGPPIGSRELLDHVRSLQVDRKVHHVIGVCSPTGFTQDALDARSELSNITLVLVQPSQLGGWHVSCSEDDVDERVMELFDPEETTEKEDRVAEFLEKNSSTLLTGSFSASQVAERMQLAEDVVERAFERYADRDPELHSSRQDGEMLIFRGAAAEPKETAMSMVDRIRQLFSRDDDDAEKITELSRSRASLSHRRDRLYEDIIKLEKREADLLEQGKANKSSVVRRRIAAQLSQLRKDIKRQNASTATLNKQIDILSTHIHNLTLKQQGEAAELPDTDELTEGAVAAEEMLETLQADAELVGSLETGVADALTSNEELEILKEFEELETAGEEESPSTTAAERQPPVTAEPDADAASAEEQPPRREPEAS